VVVEHSKTFEQGLGEQQGSSGIAGEQRANGELSGGLQSDRRGHVPFIVIYARAGTICDRGH